MVSVYRSGSKPISIPRTVKVRRRTENSEQKKSRDVINNDMYDAEDGEMNEEKKDVQEMNEKMKFKEALAKLRAQTVDSAARTGLWWFVWLWIMLQSGFIITAYRKEKDNQDPQYTRQISKGLYLFAVVSMTTGWVAFLLRLLRHVPMSKAVKVALKKTQVGDDEVEMVEMPSTGGTETGETGGTETGDVVEMPSTGGKKSIPSRLASRAKSAAAGVKRSIVEAYENIQAMDATRANVVKTSEWMSNVYLLILWNFVLGCWAVNDTRKSPNPGPNKTVLGLGAAAIVVGVLALLVGIFGAWLKKIYSS
jgi:hypothetical protein